MIESISADGKSISPLIIISGILIIETWFYKNITEYKFISVSLIDYIIRASI
jgi:hypothetical protein